MPTSMHEVRTLALVMFVVATCAMATASCALLPLGDRDEDASLGDAKGAQVSKKTAAVILDEHDLKLAKLWTRVDELEEAQQRQREKLVLLEKGLTFGLIPDELKAPARASSHGGSHPKSSPEAVASPRAGKDPSYEVLEPIANDNPSGAKRSGAKAELGASQGRPEGMSASEHEDYVRVLASAHDQYRAGRWARAIVEYTDIGKRYGAAVAGGMHKYFIAASWVGLKEYNQARQQFQDFIKEYPQSPWVPRAKVELGRVYRLLGLPGQAVEAFQGVIAAHPYSDAAEMAKMEMSNKDSL